MPKRAFLALFVLVWLTLLPGVLSWGQTAPQPVQAQFPTGTPTLTPSRTPTITRTPIPGSFGTPQFTPSLTPGCPAASNFTLGSLVLLRSGVIIRNNPTQNGAYVGYTTEQTRYTVIGGPVCAENLIWWQIAGPGNPGWVAQEVPGLVLLFPFPTPTGDPCPVPLPFTVGGPALTARNIRLRSAPTLTGDELTVLLEDTFVTILAGPQCVDGYNWWQVRAPFGVGSSATIDGWLAEGLPGDYWFVVQGPPPTFVEQTCLPPYRVLGIGVRGYITYSDGQPRLLRSAPNTGASVLYELLANVQFTILDGPVCSGTFNWWQIQVIGDGNPIGWVAEGRPGDYWLQPQVQEIEQGVGDWIVTPGP